MGMGRTVTVCQIDGEVSFENRVGTARCVDMNKLEISAVFTPGKWKINIHPDRNAREGCVFSKAMVGKSESQFCQIGPEC